MSDGKVKVRKAREADYTFWLRHAQWNPVQAAILLAGYEPEASPDSSLGYESLAEDVDGIHRLIIDSINSKDIAVVNSPTDWIAWAKRQNLTLPPALVKTGASSSSAGGGVTDTSDDVTPVGAGDTPSERRAALDITAERGARRRILEEWDSIAKAYGDKADGRQVLRFLKLDKDAKQPQLKTVQNHLSKLRGDGLIP